MTDESNGNLHDAAADLADAAEDVADATAEVPAAAGDAGDAIDVTPIADAIGDAASQVTDLDHEGRLATLEATIGSLAPADHTHFDLAAADHSHVDLTPEPEIPAPPALEETGDDEPTDEPPERTHPLLARPFASR